MGHGSQRKPEVSRVWKTFTCFLKKLIVPLCPITPSYVMSHQPCNVQRCFKTEAKYAAMISTDAEKSDLTV